MFLFDSTEGGPHNHARLLLDNPSDSSTYLGYQDHHNHDMLSLVNEASVRAHGTGSSDSKPLSFAGTNLWRCDAHVVEVCDLNCLDVDPKDGCPFCVQSCRKCCFFVLCFCFFVYFNNLSLSTEKNRLSYIWCLFRPAK